MTDFKVGDRIVTKDGDASQLNTRYRNQPGEITEVMDSGTRFRLSLDNIEPPNSNAKGWIFNSGTFVSADVSEEEVATLFGLNPPPSEESTQVELLQYIDQALRGGKLTRANLAFEFLLKSLDLTRLDLPSYVHDMQEDK